MVTRRGWVERDYQKPCFGERWMAVSADKVGRHWWDGVKGDLKELGLALHWRKLCQNREKWGKSIKPVKKKATKGELAAGRATKAELHFSQPRYMQRHKCVTTRKKG